MTWQETEHEVRKIAESVWAVAAEPEREAGIKCDAILKPKKDYWVLIEISKQDSLSKLREDLAKLGLARQALLARGIYSECYFITSGEHSSLRESGEAINVEVHDIVSFAAKFLGGSLYLSERRRTPFGSAVNPDDGSVDTNKYTHIGYDDQTGKRYSVAEITHRVRAGSKILLIGEFGTGKSRCLMEVFEGIAADSNAFVPVAINLRDNWGYKRLGHIIQNHMDSLGLGKFADNLVRSLRRGNHPLLLDGFDEIGSQSWTGDPSRLAETRKSSLEGVRDLIAQSKGSGVLITGREHYFSSDEEMFESLGINSDDAVILRCPDEFTEEETVTYIRTNTALKTVPEWVPRKPLICQLLARLDQSEVDRLEMASNGEVEFFESVFDSVCQRETRINPAINKEILKGILLELAQGSRTQPSAEERISTLAINKAFYDVSGHSPIDESAVLLQRLPYLGRVGSGSSDRIFIDAYAKNGLRGLALAHSIIVSDKLVQRLNWQQALDEFGIRVLSTKISTGTSAEKFVRQCINYGNSQIACDYVSMKLLGSAETHDFSGLSIFGGTFETLRFSEGRTSNLKLSGVYVARLVVEAASFENVLVEKSIVQEVDGVGDARHIPNVFVDCEFGSFRAALTTSRISELEHSDAHKTLLALIKKLFFQPGSGRQEDALLRGAEAYWDKDAADRAIGYMISNDIIAKVRGAHGALYLPRRRQTTRMAKILEMQSSCGDELWQRVVQH